MKFLCCGVIKGGTKVTYTMDPDKPGRVRVRTELVSRHPEIVVDLPPFLTPKVVTRNGTLANC